MTNASPQTLANHKRIVPGYHFIAASLLLLNFGFTIWMLVKSPSFATAVALTTAFAILLVGFYARGFAVAVQNRVIRLEERLRLQRLLPQEMQSRIDDFTVGQLVALRFAGDDELASLAGRVLEEDLVDPAAIKKLVVHWRADECRA